MVAICTPLLQTRYCSLFELNKTSAEESVITAYWKSHAIDKTLPQTLYDTEDIRSRVFDSPDGKESITQTTGTFGA